MDYSQLCSLSESKWTVSSLSLPLFARIKSLQPVIVDLKSWFNIGSIKKWSCSVDVSYDYLLLFIMLIIFDNFA